MNDETQFPQPADDDSQPEILPPLQDGEELPDWLKRIRARREAEAAARGEQAAASLAPAGQPAAAPPEPEPPLFESVPQPETLPGWLRVAPDKTASDDGSGMDETASISNAVQDELGQPITAPESASEPGPMPQAASERSPIPTPPQPMAPVDRAASIPVPPPSVDPDAEAPAWLREAVAAKASAAADTSTPAPTVPVRTAEASAAQADPDAEEALLQAAREARAQRRRERRAQARRTSPLKNALQSLVVVAAAAAMIATIFTFWTPASFLSDETREGLRPAYATLSAQSPPTPVPTPVWMRRVGVVSGHWGPYPSTGRSDPGAVCPDGFTEAEVNRSVAQLVVQQLSGRGYDVDLLDEWDPRLDGYQASVLVSIHADSCFEFDQPGATGFKVAPPASRTSARADDLRLQDCLIREYGEITNLPLHPSLTRDMTEYHSFREISEVTPANIIELGFLFEDRDILENRPDLLAEGIVSGLLCFLENAPPTPLPELTPWPTLEATPTPLENPGVS